MSIVISLLVVVVSVLSVASADDSKVTVSQMIADQVTTNMMVRNAAIENALLQAAQAYDEGDLVLEYGWLRAVVALGFDEGVHEYALSIWRCMTPDEREIASIRAKLLVKEQTRTLASNLIPGVTFGVW